MAYCTQQDMIDRFGELELIQLTDRHDVNAIDPDVLDRAVERGASDIENYCRDRYVLPLSPVDPMIVAMNADLARFYLYDEDPSDIVQKRYDTAMRFLRDISNGTIKLSSTLRTGSGSSGSPQFDSGDRVFTRDTLKGF